MDALDHFAVLTQTATPTVLGFQVYCLTNNLVHLWLRWTRQNPWLHITRAMERGAPLYMLPRYCFTSFYDVEQNEAGDTYAHTFTIEPVQPCRDYWYYMLGTVGGVESPSRTALFQYFKPAPTTTQTFYSENGVGVTTCDAMLRAYQLQPWAILHNLPACNDVNMTYPQCRADINDIGYQNKWYYLWRGIMTFNTSVIPATAEIVAAFVHVWGGVDYRTNLPLSSVGFSTASPAAYNTIAVSDFSKVGDTIISETVPCTTFSGQYDLTFNQAGRDAINKGGITAIAFREATYDIPNIEPPHVSGQQSKVGPWIYSKDKGGIYTPYLQVSWRDPCP